MFGIKVSKSNLMARILGRAKSESGAASIEAVIVLPALVGMYAASFVWFDAYRHSTLSMKATYVVSDIMSRDATVDHEYMDNLENMINLLVPGAQNVSMRVTLVHFDKSYGEDDKEGSEYRAIWSYSPDEAMQELTQADLDADSSWIPIMSNNDSLVLTQTEIAYRPLFSYIWTDQNRIWENSLATRPRFYPTLVNSDQPQPANSIDDVDRLGEDDDEVVAVLTDDNT